MMSHTGVDQAAVDHQGLVGVNGDRISSTKLGTKRKRPAEPKFYSVRSGHKPGVYHSWGECLEQVTGFKGAKFKSFPTLTDAERFLAGEEVDGSRKSKSVYKFYAVREGRAPGIYTDWSSVQQQITGWTKPEHRCFSTRAEAQRWIDMKTLKSGTQDGEDDEFMMNASFPTASTDTAKRQKKGMGGSIRPKSGLGTTGEAEDMLYEPGLTLPIGAEDGFDPNILLGHETGNVLVKTRAQKTATKLRATGPAHGSMIRVYTDGSTLRNGQEGPAAGVGVYFGPCDTRNLSEPIPSSDIRPTNQRAELMAVLRALEIVPMNRDLAILSDSQYAINCASLWYEAWEKNNWRTTSGKQVDHRDVIEAIRAKINSRNIIGVETTFEWVKGHDRWPGNHEADGLAVKGAREAAELAKLN